MNVKSYPQYIIPVLIVALLAMSIIPAHAFNQTLPPSDSNPIPVQISSASGVTTTILATSSVANTGSSAPAAATQIGGADASGNLRAALTSASGVQYIIMESVKASYRASASDVIPAASATDITALCGSATKTVRVNRISVTADANSVGVLDLYVIKRTSSNTGGATSSVAIGQMDSNDPAPTATMVKYTANPSSLGAGVLIASDHYALPAATSTGYPGVPWGEDFGTRNNETLVLRGTSQCVTVNLSGQAIPAGTVIYINAGWTEE